MEAGELVPIVLVPIVIPVTSETREELVNPPFDDAHGERLCERESLELVAEARVRELVRR